MLRRKEIIHNCTKKVVFIAFRTNFFKKEMLQNINFQIQAIAERMRSHFEKVQRREFQNAFIVVKTKNENKHALDEFYLAPNAP